MFDKIKKHLNKIAVVALSAVGLISAGAINAQVTPDADVGAMAGTVAETLKVNFIDVLTDNLPILLIVGVAVAVVMFIWRIFKRMSRG